MSRRTFPLLAVLLLAVATPLAAQRNLARRLERRLDAPPFDRASWGVVVMDTTGRVLFQRNGDRLFMPASNTKLIVTSAASALLPPDFHIVTSVYGNGTFDGNVLHGDLIIYGRGDPTFSDRCYGVDTTAAGACDSMWTRMDALADSLIARGIHQVDGQIVGDGSWFAPLTVQPSWQTYDLNWWYAAPVTGLGFNDNSLDITWQPGPNVGAPATITIDPDLQNFTFENRTVTVPAGRHSTIDFFREPGTMHLWAEGTVATDHAPHVEYFAVPDPNLFFAQALRDALARKGVSVTGATVATTDSLAYHDARQAPALVSYASRPFADILFPILNSSQNWFAEMLLKTLGKVRGAAGSWTAGIAVETSFLVDSVGVDSASFNLVDGSGLSTDDLVSPRTFAELLRYMYHHPNNAAFMRALPHAGERGSLRDRFGGTPLAGRVIAKTGSISHVNSLSGYVQRPDGKTLIVSIIANNHDAKYNNALNEIDSLVVEIGR